jgi:hypothetical protein
MFQSNASSEDMECRVLQEGKLTGAPVSSGRVSSGRVTGGLLLAEDL